MVLDIHAVPSTQPEPGATVPGKVKYASGGVARNIAECLSKLGSDPFMISVLGNDMAGERLLKYWKSAGLLTKGILQVDNATTPVVSIVYGCSGESVAAVASVEAVESFLTPGWINRFHHNISSAPMLLVDANLPQGSLQAACRIAYSSDVPVWFEPVSVAKSTRIVSIAKYVTCASPNENELIAMANELSPTVKYDFIKSVNATTDITDPIQYLLERLQPPMHILLEAGLELLLVTLGSNGVFVCCRKQPRFTKNIKQFHCSAFSRELFEKMRGASTAMDSISGRCIFHFPAAPASVVSLTGAGDCFVGGVMAALCSGVDLMASVTVGIAVARVTVESEANVPLKFSIGEIADVAKALLSEGKLIWSA